MVAIVPLTGVPLPLVSYGGSNLISMLVGFGILLNISRYTHKKA
jgi:cell division protein FtsW